MSAEGGTTGNPTNVAKREWLARSHPTDGFTPYTASRIAYEGGKLRLRHYAPVEPAYSTPILFVYALIKRAFILDLAPGHSVVHSLAQQGFHVYLTDWLAPARGDSWRGLDTYVNEDLASAMHVGPGGARNKPGINHRLLSGRPAGGHLCGVASHACA
jgi:poly(3-hydroxyalkanoate) synthetase